MLEHFKNELKNYNYYRQMLKSYNERIDNAWYELSMVKGIRYDKQAGSASSNSLNAYKYALMKKLDLLEAERDRIELQLEYLDSILVKIDDIELRQALIDVYVNKMTLRQASKKYYISHTALLKRFNKAINQALKTE